MKSLTRSTSLAAGALLLLALAACGTTPVDSGAKTPIDNATTTTAQPDGRGVQNVTTGSSDPLTQGALAKRSVYFDLDSYAIKPEFQTLIEAHAKYLRDNKTRKVSIEGNTDDRGSREYNLALGQKRAEAVKKAFSLLGVGDSQVEAVSFGKEKPRATGEDEAAWAENRRADIRYL
jgi:peptidoglycan-associated lipoprotein